MLYVGKLKDRSTAKTLTRFFNANLMITVMLSWRYRMGNQVQRQVFVVLCCHRKNLMCKAQLCFILKIFP